MKLLDVFGSTDAIKVLRKFASPCARKICHRKVQINSPTTPHYVSVRLKALCSLTQSVTDVNSLILFQNSISNCHSRDCLDNYTRNTVRQVELVQSSQTEINIKLSLLLIISAVNDCVCNLYHTSLPED